MMLESKNAIVTGGSHGLGKEIVREFLKEGASVLFCARNEDGVNQALDELRETVRPGRKLLGTVCDVSSPASVQEMFALAARELGPLHVLVNNAGVYGPKGLTEEVDWSEWTRAIEINLYGTLLPCRAAIPLFKQTGYGKIINLSGGGATSPLPRFSSYAAAKAAVVRLTETLAGELQPFGIDVNAVAPGALNTRLLDEVLEAGPDKVGPEFFEKATQQAAKGGAPLEKAAKLCAWLASASSNGITGRLLSAPWDPWETLHERADELRKSDIYTLRRVVPKDRGLSWGDG